MATQESYNNAVATLVTTLNSTKKILPECAEYWQDVLSKAASRTFKGNVQGTVSNPVAYFAVPLSGDGKGKGRTKEFTLDQFKFALSKGWQADTDKRLRGVDPDAIAAGLAASWARKDSALGTKEERKEASKTSYNNMVALMESNQAKLEQKRLEQKARKAASKAPKVKAETPKVLDAADAALIENAIQACSADDLGTDTGEV